MPSTGLSGLETVNDLLLYRLGRLVSTGGSLVVRLCEGQFGITRREWRLLAGMEAANGLLTFGLLTALLVVYAVLSWVPGASAAPLAGIEAQFATAVLP